ncbi:VOC family protein [Dyadobacter aurulentus]|uniref:VOC family protein n=1 Tax=Dyadobacter sp. UC 10 TaxID=2605428 RepID=UPI0011F1EE74|nr:VOC family protein [Dyadobacter sp. UC 10]KAA0993680.1 VOC family protein [Dyadobacter sp. UC 10]
MAGSNGFRGFATMTIYAADHKAAIDWYTKVFGIAPYFNKPGYSEFRIGDYENEMGIIDAKYAPPGAADKPAGVITSWHVDDLPGTFQRLLSLGATEYQPIIERGAGFITAAVVDPFGNILGIMTNPHYLEILGKNGN